MIIKLLIEIRFKNLSIFLYMLCLYSRWYISSLNCIATVTLIVVPTFGKWLELVNCTRGCFHNVFLRFDRYVGQIDSGTTSDELESYNCSLFIENIWHYSANTQCCLIQWWKYVEKYRLNDANYHVLYVLRNSWSTRNCK